MADLELRKISKSYGENKILDEINFKINAQEFLVLVGPSGCGKSTLLRMISGLDHPTNGQIFINNNDQSNVEPQKRDIAMVFQSYALYPHMSVYENMAFSLKIQKCEKEKIKTRVEEVASLLKIEKFLARKPRDLSGGQRQRVSLGRALVRKSSIILFDEPLSNLDAHLRNQMRIEIKKIHKLLGATIVYVTHDQTEAMTLGDRIVVLNKGKIEQIDTPTNIYDFPKNIFVANFIGTPEINLISGEIFKTWNLDLKISDIEDTIIGVRPENLKIVNSDGSNFFKAKIIFSENLGAHSLIYAETSGITLRIINEKRNAYNLNDEINISICDNKFLVFDKKSGKLINSSRD